MGLSTHRWQPLGFWARIIENRDGRWVMGYGRFKNLEWRIACGYRIADGSGWDRVRGTSKRRLLLLLIMLWLPSCWNRFESLGIASYRWRFLLAGRLPMQLPNVALASNLWLPKLIIFIAITSAMMSLANS